MSLEVLEQYIKDNGNEELNLALNNVKESFNNNIKKLTSYEKDIKKAVEKRDMSSNLVKSKLGIDNLTEDALDDFLSKINSNPNDKVINENKSLSDMLNNIKSEKDTIESKYNETVRNYTLEKELTKLGAVNDTENSKAYEIVLNEVRNNITFDNDSNIVFEAKDGTLLRNKDGSLITLVDFYNNIKESNEFSFLFKKDKVKTGSGTPTTKSIPTVNKLSDTKEERIAYIKNKFNLKG